MNKLAVPKTTLINGKVHQVIAVVNLDEVKNWKNKKKPRLGQMLILKGIIKTKHFAFIFKTNNLNSFPCSGIHLIGSKNKDIDLISREKKLSILKFIIEILKNKNKNKRRISR